MDLVLELKNNASKLLLAIMESRTSDSENVAEKIIYNLNPKQLVRRKEAIPSWNEEPSFLQNVLSVP